MSEIDRERERERAEGERGREKRGGFIWGLIVVSVGVMGSN